MKANAERALWFVAGVGLGAGATFLFGTRTGRQYRRQVARAIEDGVERITEAGEEVFEKGGAVLEKGKELLETGREFIGETGKRVGARLHVACK